jgi:hypothetical protein
MCTYHALLLSLLLFACTHRKSHCKRNMESYGVRRKDLSVGLRTAKTIREKVLRGNKISPPTHSPETTNNVYPIRGALWGLDNFQRSSIEIRPSNNYAGLRDTPCTLACACACACRRTEGFVVRRITSAPKGVWILMYTAMHGRWNVGSGSGRGEIRLGVIVLQLRPVNLSAVVVVRGA